MAQFKLIRHRDKLGMICRKCGAASWEWKAISNRHCQHCNSSLETARQRAWREHMEKPEHVISAFPFPPRRKTPFDKLHDAFLGIVTLTGILYLAAKGVIWIVAELFNL